jgi:hypothetical protein
VDQAVSPTTPEREDENKGGLLRNTSGNCLDTHRDVAGTAGMIEHPLPAAPRDFTDFMMSPKLRDAKASELKGMNVGGNGETVEVGGTYFSDSCGYRLRARIAQATFPQETYDSVSTVNLPKSKIYAISRK